jgi:hypothetical protein
MAVGLDTCTKEMCPNLNHERCWVSGWPWIAGCKDPEECQNPDNPGCYNNRLCKYNEKGACQKGCSISPGYCVFDWCPSFCTCNFFSANCKPCHGCGASLTDTNEDIFSIGEGQQTSTITSCDDYNEWMGLTKEEKMAHLDKYYCHDGDVINPGIIDILEDFSDSNDDEHMSCDEFNNSYDLEDKLERRRRLEEEEVWICRAPDETKTSKSEKNKSGTSKTAKTQGKASK